MISRARQALGLTQVELAVQARVALATLQALEAGKANPGWDTLSRLGEVLGLRAAITSLPADWDLLVRAGVPLSETDRAAADAAPPRIASVFREWVRAWMGSASEREREALQGYVVALRDHFPSFFTEEWKRSAAVGQALRLPVTGRIVKLRRIAIALQARRLRR